MEYRVVFITAPVDKGEEIARYLVENRLATCVNVVQKVKSIYWWQGRIEEDAEALLIVKTSAEKMEELIARVKEVHPYTVPEIISMKIEEGNPDYLRWIGESLK